MQAIVTLTTNVQVDDEGNFLFDENGNLLLINENDIGILEKIHVSQVQKLENGLLITGMSTLAEVYWQLHRSPAPALVAPADIAWVSLSTMQDDMDDVEESDENFDDTDSFIESEGFETEELDH